MGFFYPRDLVPHWTLYINIRNNKSLTQRVAKKVPSLQSDTKINELIAHDRIHRMNCRIGYRSLPPPVADEPPAVAVADVREAESIEVPFEFLVAVAASSSSSLALTSRK